MSYAPALTCGSLGGRNRFHVGLIHYPPVAYDPGGRSMESETFHDIRLAQNDDICGRTFEQSMKTQKA